MNAIQSRLESDLARDQPVAQATLLDGPGIGAKLLVERDGVTLGSLGDETLDRAVRHEALERMAAAKGDAAETVPFSHHGRVFIELFMPPPHLLIFGGVHIAIPLVRFARMLGFRVTLADPRATFANSERFPEVDRIIPEWPEEALDSISITPSTYIVILTHDPKLDEPALRGVLGKGAAYVGAIGSRKTHAERFERMAKLGIGAEALAEAYAPVGLDLKAVTPEELALSIIAEIVAVRRGGTGRFLRDRPSSSP
jgi:xanthine dehydrogenase accessory factor